MDLKELLNAPAATKILSTLILIFVIVAIRYYVLHSIKASEKLPMTTKRQWIVRTRNITLFLILGILFVVWIEQLRTIAASIVVIAAAVVVAFKEFLLNVVGYLYRTTAKFVTVGDRIEIDGIRGDVIDQNLMGITLLEIGPGDKTHQYTGLTIFLPNSLFLSAKIKSETYLWSDYVFHLMTIPVKAETNWQAAEEALLQAAGDICAPYIDKARKAMTTQAFQQSLEEPRIEPRVQIQIVEPDRYNLVLRLPVPARKRGRLEQEISKRYLEIVGK